MKSAKKQTILDKKASSARKVPRKERNTSQPSNEILESLVQYCSTENSEYWDKPDRTEHAFRHKQNAEPEKNENQNFARIKEQIEFMKNRIKYMDIAKNKNQGKIETMQKKTDHILKVRNVAEEMNKQKMFNKELKESEIFELKSKVWGVKEETSKVLLEKKEEVKNKKQEISNQVKEQIRDIKEKRKLKEQENLVYKKKLIENIHSSKVSFSEFRGEKSSLSRNGKVNPKNDGVFGGPTYKFYNAEYDDLPLDELKKQLDALMEKEARKIEELQKVISLEKTKERQLNSIAKSKIF